MSKTKLIITGYEGKIASVLTSDGRPVQIFLEPEAGGSILGNIYRGKVQNVMKNINAAFVELSPGLTGYYSLTENRRHWFGGSPSEYPLPQERPLKAGDEIMVQVSRDAVKTKAPVLTANISLTGRSCVMTAADARINFSSKITNRDWKLDARKVLERERKAPYGMIVRTSGRETLPEEIAAEYGRLAERFAKIASEQGFRTGKSLLYRAPAGYVSDVMGAAGSGLEAIVTDREDIYEALSAYLEAEQPAEREKLVFYDDPLLKLSALYSLNTVISQALQPRVWLRSGGYLVIEPTEAMTVIDVNTGKFSGKKQVRETLMKINLEAAEAVAAQLRLRNLSGIIVVDFIDMETEEERACLMETLRRAVRPDPVKTAVVDITPLGLVEITRKKVRRPLYEQARQ